MCPTGIAAPSVMSWEEKVAAAEEQERLAVNDDAIGYHSKAELRRGYAAALRELAWEAATEDVPAEGAA